MQRVVGLPCRLAIFVGDDLDGKGMLAAARDVQTGKGGIRMQVSHTKGNVSPEEDSSSRPIQMREEGSFRWRLNIRTPAWRPPTDVFETDTAVIVRMEVAGMQEEDFVLKLDGRVLTVQGIRSDIAERRTYHHMEIRFGEFSAEVELPVPVIPDQVQASYTAGFLRVVLPKARPQPVHVEET